jgi:hypothetical protein
MREVIILLIGIHVYCLYFAVSVDSKRYANLFLIEREYFGFNTLESVVVEYI